MNDFGYRFFMFGMTEEDVIKFIKDLNQIMNLKHWCSMKELMFQKQLTLIKQVHQNSICFVIIGSLNILNLNLKRVFVINVVLGVSFRKQKTLQY